MFDSWRQRLDGLLPKGRVARSILALASGTAAAQAITACAMPIVTRLYTPSQIGVISLFLAFFTFWAPALSLRYEYALLIAQDDVESHAVYRVATLCVFAMSILAIPLLFGLSHLGVLGFSVLPWWVALVAWPIFLGYGQFMVLRSWALRAGLVKHVTKATVYRSAANVLTRIAFGLLKLGVVGLFVAEFAKAWSSFGTLHRAVHRQYADSRPLQGVGPLMRKAMRRYSKFPAFEMPSTLLDALGMSLPIPMIVSLFSTTAAGWFGMARMLVAIPNAQIGGAIADVFQMELADAVRSGQPERARKLFFGLLRKLGIYGLVPMVAVMAIGPWLASFVFGKAWAPMGIIAASVAPWLYAGLVVSSLSRLVSVLEAQQLKFAYDIAATGLMALAYTIAKHHSMGLYAFVAVISAVNVTAYVVYLALMLRIVQIRFPVKGN